MAPLRIEKKIHFFHFSRYVAEKNFSLFNISNQGKDASAKLYIASSCRMETENLIIIRYTPNVIKQNQI